MREPVEPFENMMRCGGITALAAVSAFLTEDDRFLRRLRTITATLTELDVSYAITGGMALAVHGCPRTTADVSILVTDDALMKIHRRLTQLHYVPADSRGLRWRDRDSNVTFEFEISGEPAGGRNQSSLVFPNPEDACVEIDGMRFLQLPALIELKLASGMRSLARLNDLADVQELIRLLKLDAGMETKLHPFVRPKFQELLVSVAADSNDDRTD